ncbi:MAG TPA: lipoyl(octanoyl) transferase LipB [Aestuariivirgaceae bacterium]|nr:lipoyl(octanoyl) transferase LipB [Aestuariivirgaceae bacterium]
MEASAAPVFGRTVEWEVSPGLVDYPGAVSRMELLAASIARSEHPEQVWLLEHPPLYTAGTSARDEHLLDPGRFPVFRTGRGGQFTYHGPGQRVAYVMLDLNRRGRDVRAFVRMLEDWLIRTLADIDITAESRDGRIGLWVQRPKAPAGVEDKIAAIGIRLHRWVSFHGISLNVAPDLAHYSGIVACGIASHGVTSLRELGSTVSMAEVDTILRRQFEAVFGPTIHMATARP